mgnify:CR=1 FL=1
MNLEYISRLKPVFPKPSINQIVQNRFIEKNFINNIGIRTTNYVSISNQSDISNNEDLLPGLLKTCTLGYDGKGQFVLKNKELEYFRNFIIILFKNFVL